MAADEAIPVDEADFYKVLKRLRDVRAWAALAGSDPWAFRQALITVMAIDTAVALESEVTPESLAEFDMVARARAMQFIDSNPEEARAE